MSFQPELIMNGHGPLRIQIEDSLPPDLLREQLEQLLLGDSPLTELEELEEDEQSRSVVEKKNLAKERRKARREAQEEKYRLEQPSELFPELLPFLSDDNSHLWKPPKFPLPEKKERQKRNDLPVCNVCVKSTTLLVFTHLISYNLPL